MKHLLAILAVLALTLKPHAAFATTAGCGMGGGSMAMRIVKPAERPARVRRAPPCCPQDKACAGACATACQGVCILPLSWTTPAAAASLAWNGPHLDPVHPSASVSADTPPPRSDS